jgi:hypothetical protein
MLASLEHLVSDAEALSTSIERIIEQLIVQGDLLDLTQVARFDDGQAKSTLFAARPSFVARSNGRLILLGIP